MDKQEAIYLWEQQMSQSQELRKQNADLLAALKDLVDWYDYDPNCIDDCPACVAYANAKQAIKTYQAQSEN